MAQPVRSSAVRPQSFWDTVKERIEIALAVDNLNLMLAGEEQPPQVERSTLFTLSKAIPSLQAVAIDVQHHIPANWQDIQAKALEHGIDPKLLISQEKDDCVQVDSDGGTPPDVDA